MITTARALVVVILVVVVAVAAWSRLRHLDGGADHEPQRWRLDQHPAFSAPGG
jgi:hypothetical protein